MDGFKVGDRVTVYAGGWDGGPLRLLKVAEVLKTKVRTADGREWRLNGDAWGSSRDGYSSPERIHHIRDDDAARILARAQRAVCIKRLEAARKAVSAKDDVTTIRAIWEATAALGDWMAGLAKKEGA